MADKTPRKGARKVRGGHGIPAGTVTVEEVHDDRVYFTWEETVPAVSPDTGDATEAKTLRAASLTITDFNGMT